MWKGNTRRKCLKDHMEQRRHTSTKHSVVLMLLSGISSDPVLMNSECMDIQRN